MKRTVYLCNRCRRDIKAQGMRLILQPFDAAGRRPEGAKDMGDDVHFCAGCAKKVLAELADPPEGKRQDTPGEEPGEGKKRRRLDAGKVMALHRAGWSNGKIADEMGADERQIYQCIRYQKSKEGPDAGPDGKERGE